MGDTVRELAILLLDDEYGINLDAWVVLKELLDSHGHTDICDTVRGCENRVYICPRELEEYDGSDERSI